MDILVAGLGNPGGRYAATRHNVGFRVAELLASRHGASPERTKHGGLLQEVRLPEGQTLALFRPQEYMNLSGGPVARAVKAYGVGLAGHNGLRSLAERVGSRDFLRVRLGIGRPGRGDPRDIADWVLAPFELGEDPEPMIEAGADAVELIAREGIDAALAAYP